jgi:hypothetical protein
VLLCVGAFETVLSSEGADVQTGVAEAAATRAFRGAPISHRVS